METELVAYFEDILTENEQDRAATIQKVSSHIPSIASKVQNTTLMRPTTLQEVTMDVSQMKEDKASGLDGFTVKFFRAC